jgi:23S rRNA (cytosine1962-C5)-methyltransferase
MADIVLKPGRERAAHNQHPWIFGGAVQRIEDDPPDGEIVAVRDATGAFLARGYLNRQSQIVVRLLSWDETESIDGAFWARQIERAVGRRSRLAADPDTTAYRLIYAEADRLPGLIVDRYEGFLVVQCLTLGIAQRQEEIGAALRHIVSPDGIYERSDVDVRAQEGLPPTSGIWWGQEPPGELEIREHGHRFLVGLKTGQKTGFYLDQRDNRQLVTQYASGRETLNAFAYTGAFSVYAAAAGAGPITNLDSSAEALNLAERNTALNGLARLGDSYERGDAFEVLRRYRDQGRAFDLIVLDPPKFAPTRHHAERAARAYKDINLLAIKLLRPGGILFTFSCSGGIDAALFQKIIFGASIDAGRDVQVLQQLSQGADHPILLSFPESAYLKGFICRVL